MLRGDGRAATALPAKTEAALRLGWKVTRFNRRLDNVCENPCMDGTVRDLGRRARGGRGPRRFRKRVLVIVACQIALPAAAMAARIDEPKRGQLNLGWQMHTFCWGDPRMLNVRAVSAQDYLDGFCPRVLGLLALLPPGWILPNVDTRLWFWYAVCAAWFAAGMALLAGWQTDKALALVVALAVGMFLTPRSGIDWDVLRTSITEMDILLGWLALSLLVTQGYPVERAVLLRSTATTFYVFAAVAKLNPEWLNGDQLHWLVTGHSPHLDFIGPLFESTAGIVVAAAVVAVEMWLGVGLWFARTRRGQPPCSVSPPTPRCSSSSLGKVQLIPELIVLNGAPLAAYPAFFDPIGTRTAASVTA